MNIYPYNDTRTYLTARYDLPTYPTWLFTLNGETYSAQSSTEQGARARIADCYEVDAASLQFIGNE